jgi:hypothetical protein
MNTQSKNGITNIWASNIKTLLSSSLLTPAIHLPWRNKCDENSILLVDDSCANNMINCIAEGERTVFQEMHYNIAECNEPAKCNLRSSWWGGGDFLIKEMIFYGFKIFRM